VPSRYQQDAYQAIGAGERKMSRLAAGVFGAIAVSLTFGAVQFALGRDLSPGEHPANSAVVNRAAKANRAAAVAPSGVPTQTISLHLRGFTDTSVLVRIPVAQAGRSGALAPSLPKRGTGRATVACEPVVSVLTEVAKQLPPGRCVT
jgi:hypothetical protein